jgi:hypothetical protein
MARATLQRLHLLQFIFVIQTTCTFQKATLFRKWSHSLVTCYFHNHTQLDTTLLLILTQKWQIKRHGDLVRCKFETVTESDLSTRVYWITALLEKYAVSIFSFQGSANAEVWPTHNLSPAFKTCKSTGSDVIREECFYFANSVQDINRQWRHEKDPSREANSCSDRPVMELLLRYRRQPAAGNLSCLNAFHTLTFCLFKNQFNTALLSKPRCSKLPLHFFLIPYMHATCLPIPFSLLYWT